MLGIIALGAATAAAALGTYNTAQVDFLKTELTEVQENSHRLFEIAGIHENQISEVANAIRIISSHLTEISRNHPAVYDARLSRMENQLRDRIRQATHALQAAQWNRLSVDYLTPALVKRLFNVMKTHASDMDCQLLIEQPSDLYQIETSLLFDGANAHLLLHVPMGTKDSLLRLYRLNPFPLPVFNTHFLIPRVKLDILAISDSEDRRYLQLSVADLQSCHKLGSNYLCDQFGVQSKNRNNTCLGALYNQQFEDAQVLCEFDLELVGERIYPLRGNRFLIYLNHPQTRPLDCTGATTAQSLERHLGAGQQYFRLPPGCKAKFRHHVIYSDLAI